MPDSKLIKTEYTIIAANGAQKHGSVEWPEEPTFAQIAEVVEPVLRESQPGADLEHVRMFHNGEYTSMFVDDCGAIKRLPVNELATAIYYANVKVHDPSYPIPASAAKIHGTAILFSRNVWN